MDDYFTDVVVLVDDEGTEHEFEILDMIEVDEGVFYALLPDFESEQQKLKEDTYFIFQAVESESGEVELAEVEDEELLDSLAEIFEDRFEELYEDLSDEIVQ